MADIGWRRRRGSSPAARRGARQRAGLDPASASNTLSCQRETLHSQQLRSIEKSIDSDHGIYWKGYLKLALVSCPIALHAACSSAERIALRQINKATGNRLRQQLIDEETREPVAPEHKGRGYEVAKGQYLSRAPTPSRSTDLCRTP